MTEPGYSAGRGGGGRVILSLLTKKYLVVLLVFIARCYAERGIAAASRPSVCDVEVSWSYSLEFLENKNNYKKN